MRAMRIVLLGCFAWAVTAAPVRAQTAESDFGQGYYLEAEEENPAAAAEFYERVIKREGAPAELVEKARNRLAICREDLRSRDLSRLMPPEVLAYVELRSPGQHLARILEMAGLAASGAGGATADSPLPFNVSPRILNALRGAQGAAVAITAVDPFQGNPSGVAVVNLGRDDLAYGLIETALSGAVAAEVLQRAGPIRGHAAYASPFGTVVMTERLVIAGSPHDLVVDAVERLEKEEPRALDRHEVFADLAQKREDALLFAFIDAKRVIELAEAQMARFGGVPEEYLIAQAVMDVESFRWTALALGTFEEGIFGDLWLRLDEDNHALAFHLLRTAPVGREALAAIPAGVAGFLAFGLSDEGLGASSKSRAARQVTGLDMGREVFANVRDVMAFVTPPPAEGAGGWPGIPGVGIVMTVRDAERSRALWNELLRIPATLLQAEPNPVGTEEIDGREVHVYAFPESFRVYFASLDDRVILANSGSVVSAAARAAEGKGSVLQDKAFAKAAAQVTAGASKVAAVHAGRALEIAPPFRMGDQEARMIASLLEDKTVTVFTEETPSGLKASVVATLPRLGALMGQALSVSRISVGRPRTEQIAVEKVMAPPQVPQAFRDRERVEEIVASGSEWKYSDTGADLGASWRQPDHEDGAWKSGRAPLGYGDDFIATAISYGDDEDDKHVTAYFRRTFAVDHPGKFGSLLVRLRRDDGAAVYINGVEVLRDNLPPGADSETLSPQVAGGMVETFFFPSVVKPDVLRQGENTIAVEVHQSSGASSDLTFDLELLGRLKGEE